MVTGGGQVCSFMAMAKYDKGALKRGEYKECIQLVIVYLGGEVAGFRFRCPGADHHARWMSKFIYDVKLALLSDQYDLSPEDKTNVLECANQVAVSDLHQILDGVFTSLCSSQQ